MKGSARNFQEVQEQYKESINISILIGIILEYLIYSIEIQIVSYRNL